MFPICIGYSSRDLLTSCVVVNGLQENVQKRKWNLGMNRHLNCELYHHFLQDLNFRVGIQTRVKFR